MGIRWDTFVTGVTIVTVGHTPCVQIGMNHEPSTYTGSITLTFQQMMEVHKAIRARLVHLTTQADENNPYNEQDIEDLLAVGQLLDEHETRAVQEWEEQIARTEANQLDDDEALRKFLDGN